MNKFARLFFEDFSPNDEKKETAVVLHQDYDQQRRAHHLEGRA